MWIFHFTTSQRCSIGLRYNNCEGLITTANVQEISWSVDLSFVTWHLIRRWAHYHNKGMDIIRNYALQYFITSSSQTRGCNIGWLHPLMLFMACSVPVIWRTISLQLSSFSTSVCLSCSLLAAVAANVVFCCSCCCLSVLCIKRYSSA